MGVYYKGENDKLYFGGLNGVNWFNLNEFSFNFVKLKIVILKVEMFG